MSTHSINVIEIKEIRRHENADNLEIIPVGGWQAIVKAGQFKVGDRAVYIEPDYTVPTARQEFAFLAKNGRDRHRLKAVRLRGVLSYGLLIPIPPDISNAAVGDDVMSSLGIERYEPSPKFEPSGELPLREWSTIPTPVFDLESLQKFPDIFRPEEPVIVTEKIHGANARYLWDGERFYIGSRTRWLKPYLSHAWRQAVDNDPRIEAWCRKHPNTVLYGEIYGPVQSLKYNSPTRVSFAAFAATAHGIWLNAPELLGDATLPVVPILYKGPFDLATILPLAEEDSTIGPPGHMREGLVIVPESERHHEKIGRVALKHVSTRYWESEA